MKIFKNLITCLLSVVIVLSSIASIGIVATASSVYPESNHNYANNTDTTWTYNHTDSSATSLNITFSSQTLVETNYDYIYIYTLSGSLVGKYTGDELAGETVTVNGNGFKIRLTSDSMVNNYGFSITNISANGLANTSYPESSHDYSSYTDYTWTYNHTDSSATSLDITFSSQTFVETYCDYIYIYTLSGSLVGKYTGDELAGETVTVNGNGFKIRLTSDSIGNYYGFSITDISANTSYPESSHDYSSYTDYTWTYYHPDSSAKSLSVKFNASTYVENAYDYIYIYTLSNELVGTYTGDELAGKTIYVEGNGFKIRLDTDGSDNYYGFKIDDITSVNTFMSECDIALEKTSYIYTGSAHTPAVTVKYGETLLTNDVDYTVSYSNNTHVGTASVVVTGKGLYGGTVTKTFTIAKASLSNATISVSSQKYTGSALKPAITVKLGGKTLSSSNYTVTYTNNIKAGTATVKITGKGSYTGTATKTFTIAKASLSNATISVSSQRYTGSALKPAITVKLGGKTLSSSDYTVTYTNNIKVGTATVKITAKSSNVTGSKTATFKILTPILPESEHPYGSYLDKTWTYKYYESADYIKVKFNTKTYVEPDTWDEDEDRIYIYTLSGSLVGKYTGSELSGKTITVKSAGFKIKLKSGYQYSWDDNYGFKIDSVTGYKYVNLSKCSIKLSKTSVTYNGSKQTPSVTVKYGSKTLKKNTDYTVSYSRNTNVGTAKVTITGKGTYTGKVTKTFSIKKLSLSKVTVSKISSQAYTGKAIKPKITIKSGSKTISSSNYTVKYSNNKKVGTATVTIKAKGSNMSSSKKVTFKITPKLSYEKKNMYKGKTFTLKLNGVSLSKVKFTSSKKSVCTVSSKGVVKGIKAGTAIITAKYNGKSYKCKVTVLATASSSTETKYYKNHDDVPDFGALVKIEPTSKKTSTTDGDSFVYSLSDLQKVDPDKEAGSKYQKLLVKCKFEKKGTTKISGKSYYKYVSKNKIVYFGIASKNGEVKIIVKKK